MKKYVLQTLPLLLVLTISLGMFFGVQKTSVIRTSVQQVYNYWFPSFDDDTKLKFVNKENEIFVIGSETIVKKPCEVLDLYEDNGFIVAKTNQKSAICSPINFLVKLENNAVILTNKSLRAELFGFEVLGVVDGQNIKAGDVIGTIATDEVKLKVFLDEKPVPLSKLRKFL